MILPEDVPAGERGERHPGGGRRAADGRGGLRRVRGRAGGGGAALAGVRPDLPRAGSHADRRGRRAGPRADRRRVCATSSEVSCVGERVLVAGGSGYAGALAARILHRHPHFELAAVTSRSDVGDAPERPVSAPPRAARPRGARPRPPRRRRRRDRRLSRTAPPRRSSPGCAGAACASSTSAPTSACATARPTRGGTASTGRRSCSAPASTGCPSATGRQIADADIVAGPGCFPTAALLGLAPLGGEDGLVADVVIDAKTGVSGAGRGGDAEDALRQRGRERRRLRHRGAPPRRRRSTRSWRALGAPVAATFIPHLLPLDQGELLSCYVTTTRRVEPVRARRALRRRLRGRAVRRADGPLARRPRRARDEPLPHPRPRRGADRQGAASSPRSTTSGRARPRRRSSR